MKAEIIKGFLQEQFDAFGTSFKIMATIDYVKTERVKFPHLVDSFVLNSNDFYFTPIFLN